MADDSAATTVPTTTGAPPDDGLPKVFAGNLPFSATQDSLMAFFKEAAEPKYATIIHRGTRSLGYGFVAFSTESDAQKAVEVCDKKQMDGREINVEVAKPKDGSGGEGKGRRGGRGGNAGERGRGRGGRGRGRGARGGAASSTAASAPSTDAVDSTAAPTTAPDSNPRGRGRGSSRGSRNPRPPRVEPTGEPSTTTLFVANLPFKISDDDLKAIFGEYKVASAKVVRMRSGRSKGFGFIEMQNEEEQKRALGELKNVKVGERELTIKVALANQVAQADNEEGGEGEAK